jgi:hypothetical protein
MTGEAEVVVGAEVQDLAAVGEGDFRALMALDDALLLEEAGVAEFVETMGEAGIEWV